MPDFQRLIRLSVKHALVDVLRAALKNVDHVQFFSVAAITRVSVLEEHLREMEGSLKEKTPQQAADILTEGYERLRTYICNSREFIPNFGERRRQGETISTAFVESTINQVVSRRFVKKQQMQWTLRGEHLLLQARTRVLNEDLDDLFTRWYPKFRSQPQTQEPERKAA
jgi:hypothetical protein